MRITILAGIILLGIQVSGQANDYPVLSVNDNTFDFGWIY